MFDDLLRSLVASVPGARGAVFCDGEGEAVSAIGASGRREPEATGDFDLRVAGAQLATPLELAKRHGQAAIGAPCELVITGARETLLVKMLPDDYYLVVCLEPGALAARGLQRLRAVAEIVAREI